MGNLDQLFTMYMYLIYSTCSFVHLEYFMQVSRFHTHTDLTFFHPHSEIGRAGPYSCQPGDILNHTWN